MANQRQFVLWGSAGHAKVLGELIALQGNTVVALFDNNPNARPALDGVPLFVGEEAFRKWATDRCPGKYFGLVAIGGSKGADRLAIQLRFRNFGIFIDPVVHPDAVVSPTATLGAGTQVLAQAGIAADARIGAGCIINHRASIDHECVLGDGVHLAPGATLCGCVRLESNVMVGAGAVVLPRIRIGDGSIIGAGAVVTKDIPERAVAFGNPARIRRRILDE